MQILSERILSIVHELDISQSEFARKLGISFTYVNLIINNKRRKISGLLANMIQEKYGYSAGWIMTGKGDRRNFAQYAELLETIYQLSYEDIQIVFEYVLRLEEGQKNAGKDQ
jgi:transcriptional regulator with XRE-family HTH domain